MPTEFDVCNMYLVPCMQFGEATPFLFGPQIGTPGTLLDEAKISTRSNVSKQALENVVISLSLYIFIVVTNTFSNTYTAHYNYATVPLQIFPRPPGCAASFNGWPNAKSIAQTAPHLRPQLSVSCFLYFQKKYCLALLAVCFSCCRYQRCSNSRAMQ